MAEGSDGYKGLAVPLTGDFEITQRTAASDIMTITGASGQSGDFIVCQDSSGTEKFVIGSGGELTSAGGLAITAGQYLAWPSAVTTVPTTGLTAGDMFVALGSSTPQIGICYSTAANSLRYISTNTATFGRSTA